MTEHASKQYDLDLDSVRSRVLQMGGLVEAQILAATQAFATGDAALVAQVIENDARVNGYEVAIDGAINHIVVKRQPAASDLRLIMAISKIVTDLERIGDEAEKIARMSKRIHEQSAHHAQRFPSIRHAAQVAMKLWPRPKPVSSTTKWWRPCQRCGSPLPARKTWRACANAPARAWYTSSNSTARGAAASPKSISVQAPR